MSTFRHFYQTVQQQACCSNAGVRLFCTRKAVVDQYFIRNSESFCTSTVENKFSQLFLFSFCQLWLTGLYTRWELDRASQKLKAWTNASETFENVVTSFLQSHRLKYNGGSYC